jgi:hypothetical protein
MSEDWLTKANFVQASEDPYFRRWLSEYYQLESACDGNSVSHDGGNSISTRMDVIMELTDRQRQTLKEMSNRWQFNDPKMNAFGEGEHHFETEDLLAHARKLSNRLDAHDAAAAADIVACIKGYQSGD